MSITFSNAFLTATALSKCLLSSFISFSLSRRSSNFASIISKIFSAWSSSLSISTRESVSFLFVSTSSCPMVFCTRLHKILTLLASDSLLKSVLLLSICSVPIFPICSSTSLLYPGSISIFTRSIFSGKSISATYHHSTDLFTLKPKGDALGDCSKV